MLEREDEIVHLRAACKPLIAQTDDTKRTELTCLTRIKRNWKLKSANL